MNQEERKEYNRIRIREWREKNPTRAKAIAQRQADKKKAKAAKRAKKPHKAAMRVRAGVPPSGVGWYYLEDVISASDSSGENWMAFIRQQDGSEWCDIKIIVEGKRRGKANFWMAWNGERLSENESTAKLRTYKPAVFERVTNLLPNSITRLQTGNLFAADT